MTKQIIEFQGSARNWLEALPLGNGRIGAMCWGGNPMRLDLNEETVWSGCPDSKEKQRRVSVNEASKLFKAAQKATIDGRLKEAERDLMAAETGHAQAFLPVGSIEINVGEHQGTNQVRRLDLASALHTTTSGTSTAETFVSAPHDVLVHLIKGAKTHGKVKVSFDSPLQEVMREETDTGLICVLKCPIDVAPGHEPQLPGAVWPEQDEETVTVVVHVGWCQGEDIKVVVSIETTYAGLGVESFTSVGAAMERAKLKVGKALSVPVDELKTAHIEAHRELFDRVSLETGREIAAGYTDVRLANARTSGIGTAKSDPDLISLLFDYGRYLLISSSRCPGKLPANLQGLWNDSMRPPWSCAYTVNINTQMNYWAAESVNLPETVSPLFSLIEVLAKNGRLTARELGSSGWAAHHNSDAWGYTASVGEGKGDPCWAFWPVAGLWLLHHLAEHRNFGASDETFEKTVSDPLFDGAAEFLLDWLIELPDGGLGSCPSTSPENTYVLQGETTSIGVTSTMDLALIRETLSEVNKRGGKLAEKAGVALGRLPALETRVTPEGMLEWSEPFQESDPHHRHVSHLYPIYPGDQATDAMEVAAAKSLDRRGADSTGWSLAWKTSLWSRLRCSDRVDELIDLFLRDAAGQKGQWAGGLYPNLLAAHPPFQIDGNLGYVAGIVEALLQSHAGEIVLLPALPTALSSGSVRGLIARPGVIVDIVWRDWNLVSASFQARKSHEGTIKVRWGNHTCLVRVEADRKTEITLETMESE